MHSTLTLLQTEKPKPRVFTVVSAIGLSAFFLRLAFLSAVGINIGTPETIYFPFGMNGKLMILGDTILGTLGCFG